VTVTHDAATLFKNGNGADLDEGVRVEVEGTFTSAAAIAARRIEFILPTVRFRAPVGSADVVAGVSITILGNTVLDNLQDRDQDAIMANGLAEATEVEVRAYVDKLGQLFATRVRSRGGPSANHYGLQAPAATVTPPSLTALGLTIDTTSSTFHDEAGNPLTSGAFFAAVSVGTLVEISDASFDAVNQRLFGGVVSLSDDGASANLSAPTATTAASAAVSGATATLFIDHVFGNGFD